MQPLQSDSRPTMALAEIPSSINGDPELERSLVGALLQYPDQFLEVIGVLEGASRPESFTEPAHACFVDPGLKQCINCICLDR